MAARKHPMLHSSSDDDYIAKRPFQTLRHRPAFQQPTVNAGSARDSDNDNMQHGGQDSSSDAETEDSIFQSPTLLFENDKFKMLVQKQSFKRQKKFR